MVKLFLILMTVCLTACNGQTNKQVNSDNNTKSDNTSSNNYVWTKLLDGADWKKSYNFHMFEINDTLWTFHHDGSWYST
ncbi:MAG: hypothetical protein ACRC3K_00675, partial [Plesiomonas sp.]